MARMSHLFELRTGYGNRTHIARLRILSTNRYTNPALFWDCKGTQIFLFSKFFLLFFPKYS